MTSQQYQQASERLLAQARQEQADGDLAQASEKGQGATAQMLKAVAEQRGWENHRHPPLPQSRQPNPRRNRLRRYTPVF